MGALGNFGYFPIIADVILLAIIVFAIVSGARRGLVKSLYKIFSVIITIILVAVLLTPVTSMIEESQVGAVVYRGVYEQIEAQTHSADSLKAGINAESVWDMPEYVRSSSEMEGIVDDTTAVATHTITGLIIKIIAVLSLFIIIRLLISLVFLFVEGLFKIPGLNLVNVLAGMLAGAVTVLVAVFVLLGIISLDIPMFEAVKSFICETYVIRVLYDNNFLLSLFI